MFIFSAPSASAISASPALIAVTANLKAEEPEAQAFSTLNTGTPPSPARRAAIGPGIECCPCSAPVVAEAK